MTETSKTSFWTEMDSEKFNRIIAVLAALVTLLAGVIAYLQSDASARDDSANRDSKRYSLEAFGNQVSGDARVNFDANVAYQTMYEMALLANSASNRGDEATTQVYETLVEESTSLSPLLAAPYYDPQGEGQPDLARYEADTYLVEITELQERFLAASDVKDGWDGKANAYIFHMTLLAIALFLFGLSSTISGPVTRWIFAGAGTVISVIAVLMAATTMVKPVFDLRQQGTAIQDYAAGVGLAYQGRSEEAITSFDKAIAAYPEYTRAYAERAAANMELGNLEQAAADYEQARRLGDKSANLAGELGWTYYLLGRFDKATELNRAALVAGPDELWIRFDLGLSLLAAGDLQTAQAEYDLGMDQAGRQVAEAKAAGAEPPSYLWWGLADAAASLDDLLWTLESGEGSPPPDSVKDPDTVITAGEELVTRLKSLALALEYTGQPSTATVAAEISPFAFAAPIYDETSGEVVDYTEPTDVFDAGLKEFSVLFDYSEMKDGQELVFKLYVNGEEDPSWRIVDQWSLGESGTAEIPISYAYSDTFEFEPGEYIVELYVDWQLVQQGYFSILP